ncbi:MAG TPA: DEAD/DEAH box helicase, partial [Advenella sp.]|nr:DEAD/DEAH box helicase [Advenella sp.]
CVINMDLPYNAEDYVHRIGRTGRAGAKGEAIAFYTQTEERLLEDIEKLIKTPVPRGVLSIPSVFLARGHHPSRAAAGKPERYKKTFPATRATPIDDFFFRPYVPAKQKAESDTSVSRRPESHGPKPMLAVLLGGRPNTDN